MSYDVTYVVRSRFEGSTWRFWGQTSEGYGWLYAPNDEQIVQFKLPFAREFLKKFLSDKPYSTINVQIRPWECNTNDPRIEDYQGGKIYDWKAPYPHKTAQEDIEEILIIVESGVISEIQTTLPRLFVNIIDRDQLEIGEEGVSQYELNEEFCDAFPDDIHQIVGEASEESNRE